MGENTNDDLFQKVIVDYCSLLRVLAMLVGMVFIVKTYMEYFLQEELDSPSSMKYLDDGVENGHIAFVLVRRW